MKIVSVVFFVLLLSFSSLATAGPLFTGEPVTSHFEATGVGLYAGPVTTIAPGTTGAYPGISSSGVFSIAYTDATITLLSAGGNTGFSGGFTFNGVIFDVPTSVTFTNAVIDGTSTLAGFIPADLSFTANEILVNLNGLTFNSDNKLVLDISGNAVSVPEPASLSLAAAGLIALGSLRRLRGQAN